MALLTPARVCSHHGGKMTVLMVGTFLQESAELGRNQTRTRHLKLYLKNKNQLLLLKIIVMHIQIKMLEK